MKVINSLQIFLRRLDFFSITQFLRYKEDSEFKTATGGICSTIIIIVFCILFTSMGIKTMERQIITYSIDITTELDPSPVNITIGQDGQFMFAVMLTGFNLNDPNITYFDISLRQSYFTPIFNEVEGWNIPLVQCTIEHFSFSPGMIQGFQTLNGSYWLCPPLGTSFNVGGKLSSEIYSRLSLYVNRCNSTLNANCASDALIARIQDVLGAFTLAVPYVTTIINPGSQVYQTLYVQDRYYYEFTTTMATRIEAQISSYQIDTDTSILPYTEWFIQTGTNIVDGLQDYLTPVTNNNYIQLNFSKSNKIATYTRSFNKMDDFFSYVGGLIGTVMALMFILNSYAQITYGLSLAKSLYLQSTDQPALYDKFNLLKFICVTFKKITNFMGILKQSCTNLQPYLECSQQIEKQLDIAYIIGRLNFLDQAIISLLEEHQIQALHLNSKISIENSQKIRHKYEIQKRLMKQQKMEKDINNPNMVHNINIRTKASQFMEANNMIIIEAPNPNQSSQSQINSQVPQDKLDKKIQMNLIKLRTQAIEGNQVSKRILEHLNPGYLAQMPKELIPQENQSKDREHQVETFRRTQMVFQLEDITKYVSKSGRVNKQLKFQIDQNSSSYY